MTTLHSKKIECCRGAYHIKIDGVYYCMAPPDVECAQQMKDRGKFTRGKKTIFYCMHPDNPCNACARASAGEPKCQDD